MTEYTNGELTVSSPTEGISICAKRMSFRIDKEGYIHDIKFVGGCAGNTQGISKLAEGQKAVDVYEALRGIKCGKKPTSCPMVLAELINDALCYKLEIENGKM